MSALPIFDIAGGTVAGRDHSRVGKNSHDGYYWLDSGGIIVAVVCDGCGSSPHSEVGAKLGARIVARNALLNYIGNQKAFEWSAGTLSVRGLELVKRSTLIEISSVVNAMWGSFSENVRDYFLFTILGVIIDPAKGTWVFGCGDGIYYLNGVQGTLLEPANNAPSYLSYGLVETSQEEPELRVLANRPSTEIKSILLGTDGLAEFAKSAELPVPGKEEKIGPISQFWEKDLFFKNPFAIGHRLSLVNRSVSRVDWEKRAMSEAHGTLHDDTTLIAIRRKKA